MLNDDVSLIQCPERSVPEFAHDGNIEIILWNTCGRLGKGDTRRFMHLWWCFKWWYRAKYKFDELLQSSMDQMSECTTIYEYNESILKLPIYVNDSEGVKQKIIHRCCKWRWWRRRWGRNKTKIESNCGVTNEHCHTINERECIGIGFRENQGNQIRKGVASNCVKSNGKRYLIKLRPTDSTMGQRHQRTTLKSRRKLFVTSREKRPLFECWRR